MRGCSVFFLNIQEKLKSCPHDGVEKVIMVNLHFNGSPVISFSLRYTNLSRRINQKCLKVLDTLKATPTCCIVKNFKRESRLDNNEVWELEKL